MMLSPKQAAEALGISEYEIRQAIKRGDLDARNYNKASKKPRLKVSSDALAEYDAASSTKSIQPQPESMQTPTRRKLKPSTNTHIKFYEE